MPVNNSEICSNAETFIAIIMLKYFLLGLAIQTLVSNNSGC